MQRKDKHLSHTIVNRELDNLLDLSTESVLDAFLMVATIDRQVLRRNIKGTS